MKGFHSTLSNKKIKLPNHHRHMPTLVEENSISEGTYSDRGPSKLDFSNKHFRRKSKKQKPEADLNQINIEEEFKLDVSPENLNVINHICEDSNQLNSEQSLLEGKKEPMDIKEGNGITYADLIHTKNISDLEGFSPY